MKLTDLSQLDLAYAPPYSPAKDPIVVSSFVAENILNNKSTQVSVEELDDFLKEIDNNNYTLIDVRTVTEFEKGTIPNAINFPLDDIRNNIDSIKKLNRPIIIFCQRGLRGYLAELILNQNGIENVVNVAGGFKLWQMFSDKIVIPEPVLVELK